MSEESANALGLKITSKSLLIYAFPTIVMMILSNIYDVVDSLFVANLVSINALSAVNMTAPILDLVLAVGIMIATGGCAYVSRQMGKGDMDGARRNFSFLILVSFSISFIASMIALVFSEQIFDILGANETIHSLCMEYSMPIFIAIPFAMLGVILQMFFVASGKPTFGLALSFVGGILNVVLDLLFICVFGMGLTGAAAATCIGYGTQSVIGILYFLLKRNGTLYFVKPRWNTEALVKTCSNGMSEMTAMLSVSVSMIVMNSILIAHSGSDGVAAAAIVMMMQTLFSAVYMGYLEGIAPITSFNHGAENHENLRKIYRTVRINILIFSAISFCAALLLSKPLALLYASGSPDVMDLAVRGILVMSPAFLIEGFNIFASSMFTALNDGLTSAIVSVSRTFVFLLISLWALPPFMGTDGVWLSMPVAEVCTLFVSAYFFSTKKKVYHYA